MKRIIIAVCMMLFASCAFAKVNDDTVKAIQTNHWGLAANLISRDIQSDPSDAKAWYYQAQIAAKEGNRPLAFNSIKSAKTIDPSLSFTNNKQSLYALEQQVTPTYNKPVTNNTTHNYSASNSITWTVFFIFIVPIVLLGMGMVYYNYRNMKQKEKENRKQMERMRDDALDVVVNANERLDKLINKIEISGENKHLLSDAKELVPNGLDYVNKLTGEIDFKNNSLMKRLSEEAKSYNRKVQYLENRFTESLKPVFPDDNKEEFVKDEKPEFVRQVATFSNNPAPNPPHNQTRNTHNNGNGNNGGGHTTVNNNNNSSNSDFTTGVLLGSMMSSNHGTTIVNNDYNEPEHDSSFDYGSSSGDDYSSYDSNTSFDYGSDSDSSFDYGSSSDDSSSYSPSIDTTPSSDFGSSFDSGGGFDW